MSARLIQCPQCKTQLRVPAAAAKIQCPKCQTLLNLKTATPPAGATPATRPPAAPPAAAPPAAAAPAAFGPGPTAPAATPFSPAFPASAAPTPRAAAPTASDSPPGKSKAFWWLLGTAAALLVLGLLAGAGTVAYLALRTQPSAAGGTTAAAAPAAALAPAATPPLPDGWEAGEVLGASVRFPPGAVSRNKTDGSGSQRVVSAETSAVYELEVIIQSPPGDKPLDALESIMTGRGDEPGQWEPITRDGHSGFRAASLQGKSTAPVQIWEAYPHADGWVLVSYQAFSQRAVDDRPPREVQQDEAERDMPDSFVASLSLPTQYPTTTQAMNTQPRFHKLGEAEKKHLYTMYKVAYQQAHQKIKIPRGPARTRTENMLAAVLASEVKKLAAMFDVSEAEVESIGAEGRALAW